LSALSRRAVFGAAAALPLSGTAAPSASPTVTPCPAEAIGRRLAMVEQAHHEADVALLASTPADRNAAETRHDLLNAELGSLCRSLSKVRATSLPGALAQAMLASCMADADEVDIAELDAEPWIAGREGSFCHLVVVHSTRAAGYEPRLAHITNDFQVSYALVQAGAGVGLVPELAGPPPPGVTVKPVKGAPQSRRIYAAVRAGSGARPAIAAMLAALTGR